MTKADYERNRSAIHELIFFTHRPQKPTVGQHNAIAVAVIQMQKQHEYEKNIAVLAYHIDRPEALIFRDKYTMAALRAAHRALTRKIEQMDRAGVYDDAE